jgi:hypothetical protein
MYWLLEKLVLVEKTRQSPLKPATLDLEFLYSGKLIIAWIDQSQKPAIGYRGSERTQVIIWPVICQPAVPLVAVLPLDQDGTIRERQERVSGIDNIIEITLPLDGGVLRQVVAK